jgi:hypothetical protein
MEITVMADIQLSGSLQPQINNRENILRLASLLVSDVHPKAPLFEVKPQQSRAREIRYWAKPPGYEDQGYCADGDNSVSN